MPGIEQDFHLFLAAARPNLAVIETSLMIDRRIDIGVVGQAAHLATERLLLRTIGARDELAARRPVIPGSD